MNSEQEHNFRKKHFSKPTWCHYCYKLIWGLGKQGFMCKLCNYPVHPKCKSLLLKNSNSCPGVKIKKKDRKKLESPREPQKKKSPRKESRKDSNAKGKAALETESDVAIAISPQFEDFYQLGDQLGSGAFSIVRKAVHRETGKKFAVKIIDKRTVSQDLERLHTEIEVLQSVDHPYIIKLQEVFETSQFLYIVTEIVSGGELFDRIVAKKTYSERDAQTLIRKLLEALDYLHARQIVHRDLKPENLLLKSNDDDTEIKLADFGLSRILSSNVMLQTACGTPNYVAPEILESDTGGYTEKVDMWSLGVITYILLSGYPPFYSESIPTLFESIIKASFEYPSTEWDHISDSAIDFIDSLLISRPYYRMSAAEALNHSWMRNVAPDQPLPNVTRILTTYINDYRHNCQSNRPTNCDD